MLLTIIYSVLFALTSAKCCLGAGITSNIRCLQAEKTALLQFKQGLIDESNVLASWETGHVVGFVQLVWKGISVEFGENLKLLRSIDISGNNLSGDIPESVTSLLKLISLNLSSNNFSGVLPNNFGQLEMLESLDLSRNQISGSIPPSFSSLHYLSFLDLSHNNLSGRIPLSTQLQSFNASQFMGNLGLCGQPLTPECPGDAPTEEPAVPNGSGNDKTKQDDDGLISFGFYVSLALGFIIGF